MAINFPTVDQESQPVSLFQDNVTKAFKAVSQVPVVSGTYLKGISLSIGDNQINHGLLILTGWMVTRINAASSIYESGVTNRFLILNSSAVCTIDLLVF